MGQSNGVDMVFSPSATVCPFPPGPAPLDVSRGTCCHRGVGHLLGRHGTIVITRCCASPRVRRLTRRANNYVSSSLRVTHFNTGRPTSALLITKIEFVKRATGVLDPRGAVLVPALRTRYSLSLNYPIRRFGTFYSTRPSHAIIICTGASTTMGTHTS